MAEVLQYPRNFFVWVDETGSDNRDQICKFGYALRGLPPVYHRLLVRGIRMSTIAAIGCEGLVTFEMITGTTNGETFFDFIRGSVIPRMQPFPAPSSVLVLDDCSIHHIQEVKDILVQAGILLLYLPPYSPDLNPAEELFSFVKYYHDEILQYSNDSKDIIKSAFESVTTEQCNKWITHSGYN